MNCTELTQSILNIKAQMSEFDKFVGDTNPDIGEAKKIKNEITGLFDKELVEYSNSFYENPTNEKYIDIIDKIYLKINNGGKPTKRDLSFIYEIDSDVFSEYILSNNPEIIDANAKRKEIIEKRKEQRLKDLSLISGLSEDQISTNQKEYSEKNKDVKLHYGDLNFSGLLNFGLMRLPDRVCGSLYLSNFSGNNYSYGKEIILPKEVSGHLDLQNVPFGDRMVLPEFIGGDLNLSSLVSVGDMVFPQKVGGSVILGRLSQEEFDQLVKKYPNISFIRVPEQLKS